jgi:serine/threonine protein kinase
MGNRDRGSLSGSSRKGIVHRDLKPANIMLLRTGHVKVMDFGLAKQVSAASHSDSQRETLTALTRECTTVGTVPYMSPEQVQGKAVDLRSDLFSFGIVLYEMLTGVNPFKRDSAFDTAAAILKEVPDPISKYRGDIPQPIVAIITKLLAKDPKDRYQEARAAADNLQRAVDETYGQQTPLPHPALAGIRKALKRPIYLIPLIFVLLQLAHTQRGHAVKSQRRLRAYVRPTLQLIGNQERMRFHFSPNGNQGIQAAEKLNQPAIFHPAGQLQSHLPCRDIS